MVLLAPEVGLKEGEFVFMMYTSTPGNPTIGDISWERGDALDKVRIYRGSWRSSVLIDFSLTVKAETLIFISWRCTASSSAKQEKSGSIYNLAKN